MTDRQNAAHAPYRAAPYRTAPYPTARGVPQATPPRPFLRPRWLIPCLGLLLLALVAGCGEDEPNALNVSPSLESLPQDAEATLIAEMTLSDGSTRDVTQLAGWESSDESVVILLDKGLVRAVGPGHASVTVTHGGSNLQATALITVLPASLVAIDIVGTEGGVALGLPLQLGALGLLSDGSVIDLGGIVSWEVSDGLVAGIDVFGVLTGLGLGVTVVTAVDPATGIEAQATVSVVPAVLQSVELIVQRLLLPLGLTQVAKAVGHLSNGGTVDLTALVDWSSDAPGILGVAPGGVLSALGLGSATLTATEPGSGLSTSLPVEVTPAVLELLEVVPGALDLLLGLLQPLTAIGHYSDGTQIDLTDAVDWRSDDPFIAAVGDAGQVLGIGLGSTLVRATHAGSGLQAAASVNVLRATLESIEVLAQSLGLPLGLSQTLTAIGHYDDGSTRDVTDSVAWSVDDGALASIVPGGVLSALSLGQVLVTAKDAASGVTATLPVLMSDAVLESMQVVPGTTNVLLGLLQPLQAIGTFSDGSQLDLTDGVQWSSDNPLTALVNSAGGVLGLLLGNTTVRAKDAATGLEGTAAVTVKSLLGG